MPPRDDACPIELAREGGIEHVVDQCGLAGAAHARHGDQASEREGHGYVAQVVLGGALDSEGALDVDGTAHEGRLDAHPTGEVGAGERLLAAHEVRHRTAHHDPTAVLPRARADVDDPVRRADRLLVVLDHDERVAQVAQAHERLDEPLVVSLVEADAGLVEHVEHPDQARSDLRGQTDSLRLAPRQGACGAVQGEVVQAHVDEEAQPLVDLLEDPLCDLRVAPVEPQAEKELGRRADRKPGDLRDGLAAHRHREAHGFEARSAAGFAGDLAHVAREALPAGVGLGLGVPPLDVGYDPLERRVVAALAAVAIAIAHVDLGGMPVEEGLASLGRELRPRRVHADAQLVREGFDQALEVVGDMPT